MTESPRESCPDDLTDAEREARFARLVIRSAESMGGVGSGDKLTEAERAELRAGFRALVGNKDDRPEPFADLPSITVSRERVEGVRARKRIEGVRGPKLTDLPSGATIRPSDA